MHIKFERINNKFTSENDENIRNCNKMQSMLEMKHVLLQSLKKKKLDNAWRKRMEGDL